jgi:hypothetical protein
MRQDLFFLLAITASLGAAAPTASPRLVARQESKDPGDISFIKKIAAISDSYSAGIGAGARLGSPINPATFGDWKCKHNTPSHTTAC